MSGERGVSDPALFRRAPARKQHQPVSVDNTSVGSKGQAWFCTTGLPSDVVIEVGDMRYHLHKFPLVSKSRKLFQMIPEPAAEAEASGEEDNLYITLPNFPGGTEAFESAAKFCYGIKLDLTATNVVDIRCAAEYLDMAENFAEDNLVTLTEQFIARSVLRSLRESVQALKACESLLPLAEDLGIVRRCVDSIANCAGRYSDPASLFGWPVGDGNPACRRSSGGRSSSARALSWLEDLTGVSLPVFKRVVAAVRASDQRPEVLDGVLVFYARRWIPGLLRSSRRHAIVLSEAEQREVVEMVVSNMPPWEKSGGGFKAIKFLFGLLRIAGMLQASESSRNALERRIGLRLEEAKVDDLLIPSYSELVNTLYDVECAERILQYFLDEMESGGPMIAEGEEEGEGLTQTVTDDRLMRVGKLISGYLAEIASDANLGTEKFCELALAVPDHARVYDDGLYRAVDVYLKAHPGLVETERERVCGVLDFQKLTLEACTHAAQNERLPLRAVVQVLFFEQLQLRQAVSGTLLSAQQAAVATGASPYVSREDQVLHLDMDSIRSRVQDLEKECINMRKKIERMDLGVAAPPVAASGGWGSLTRRFGCKSKTQVSDSHEQTVLKGRRRA